MTIRKITTNIQPLLHPPKNKVIGFIGLLIESIELLGLSEASILITNSADLLVLKK